MHIDIPENRVKPVKKWTTNLIILKTPFDRSEPVLSLRFALILQ